MYCDVESYSDGVAVLVNCACRAGISVISFCIALVIRGVRMKLVLFFALSLCSASTWAANVLVTLDVKGMTCPLCVTVVNKALLTR